jgi:hypothetical protein
MPYRRARRRRLIVVVAVLAALAGALAANTVRANMETRSAASRDGGRLVTTNIAQANVRVEGDGPAVVLIHGFCAALDWWDEIAPSLGHPTSSDQARSDRPRRHRGAALRL